jgi:hypothetical protein
LLDELRLGGVTTYASSIVKACAQSEVGGRHIAYASQCDATVALIQPP